MRIDIVKMTCKEAFEYVTESLKMRWENKGQVVRQCSYCNAYTVVDEQSGECEINGHTHYDICDDCADRVEKDEEIEDFDAKEDEFNDYMEELDEEFDADEEIDW